MCEKSILYSVLDIPILRRRNIPSRLIAQATGSVGTACDPVYEYTKKVSLVPVLVLMDGYTILIMVRRNVQFMDTTTSQSSDDDIPR
jgi:predicted metal-dependent peptidase